MFTIKAENDSFCSLEIRQLGHLKVLNNTANYKNISPKDDLQTATASTNAFSLYGEPDKKPTGWKGTSFQRYIVVYSYGLSHTQSMDSVNFSHFLLFLSTLCGWP